MTTAFISDLHLQPQQPEVVHAFLQFMQTKTQDIEALYILGDFFEAWIGDDFDNEFVQVIKGAIRSVSDRGIPVYFMHGNRDFMVGEQFAAETGCQILPDPTVIDLYGTKTLLMHGDTLCTDDITYQEFRAMVRNPAWQQGLLSKSIQERLKLAQDLRDASKEQTSEKAAGIMDVNQDEVKRVMKEHKVQRLIHGHTHRPKVHALEVNGYPAERIVLGDWAANGWMLTVDAEGYDLEWFEISK